MTHDPFARFDSEEFYSDEVDFPTVWSRRHQAEHLNGLMVLDTEADKAGLVMPQDGEAHCNKFEWVNDYYAHGEAYKGWLFNQAQVHIIKQSPLVVFEKVRGGADTYLGAWKEFTARQKYDGRFHSCKVRYLLFFAANNRLLHHTPFRLTSKGVFSSKLGQVYKKYRGTINAIAGKPRSEKFLAAWSIPMSFGKETVGSEGDGFTCVIKGVSYPTKESFMKYFRNDGEILEDLLAQYDTYENLDLFGEYSAPVNTAPPQSAPEQAPPAKPPIQQVNQPVPAQQSQGQPSPQQPAQAPIPVQPVLDEEMPF